MHICPNDFGVQSRARTSLQALLLIGGLRQLADRIKSKATLDWSRREAACAPFPTSPRAVRSRVIAPEIRVRQAVSGGAASYGRPLRQSASI